MDECTHSKTRPTDKLVIALHTNIKETNLIVRGHKIADRSKKITVSHFE